MVATQTKQQRHAAWPYVDLGTLRFEEKGSDGLQRSWIPLLPEGTFEHPVYGELDFTHTTLAEIKQHFDAGVRGIEIALDYDHKASEGDSRAPGWIERVEFGETIGKGTTPAMRGGLWAQVRWTRIGLADIRDQIYRYVSAEVKPDYHDDINDRDYHNVLTGATLTNRPFMKNMPGIELAETSNKPWSSVNKSKLPDSCFLDPKQRRLPIYEGAGAIGPDGRYTKRGPLNLNGLEAAYAAINGAHTGKAMSGLPAGTRARIMRLRAKYAGGGDSSDGAGSQKASEVVGGAMTRTKTATQGGRQLTEDEILTEYLADRATARGGAKMSPEAQAVKDKILARAAAAKKAKAKPDASDSSSADNEDDDEEEMAEPTDGEDTEDMAEDDGDGDEGDSAKRYDDSTTPQDDTEEYDDTLDDSLDAEDDGDEAISKGLPAAGKGGKGGKGTATTPIKSAGGATGKGTSKNMSEVSLADLDAPLTLDEARQLREELANARYKLYEAGIDKQLGKFRKLHVQLSESLGAKNPAARSLAEQQVAISKRFREKYKAFALQFGYRLADEQMSAVNDLIETALQFAVVDLSRKGSSFDMEERRTVRASDARNGSVQDQHLTDAAEHVAQREYHLSLSDIRELAKERDPEGIRMMERIYKIAAKEAQYSGH